MKHQLEQRLINLTLEIDNVCKTLNKSYLLQHLTTQIIRSSSSSALNYGEAQAAESKKDFVHKVSLVLKELRETKVCLKLIAASVHAEKIKSFDICLNECDQLIAIFYKTIKSTQRNM